MPLLNHRVYICKRDCNILLPIENPTDCEGRVVTRFPSAKEFKATHIHRQISEVYGKDSISGNTFNLAAYC